METLGTVLLVFAVACAVAGVVSMMAMAGSLRARGQPINWVFIRFYMPRYISQYRAFTLEETGRPGALFYVFLITMNLALVLMIIGLVLR